MALDLLPGKLVVPTRQQLHDKFLLWTQVRNPLADTRPGGQPDLDAGVWSDAGSFIMSQAVTIANGVSRSTATGNFVDIWCLLLGTQRLGPQGAGGAVAVQASAAGAQLVEGDILTHLATQLKFRVTVSGTYANGQPVPIAGIDTGPQTNLAANTVLNFQSTRPGLNSLVAKILPQANGAGLTGGAPAEGDTACLARLQQIASNPPASGNDADYQGSVSQILGIAIQQCFTIPAVLGPGTIGIMFTLRPGTPGASRIPSASQMAAVLSVLAGGMPASDGIYMCSIVPSKVNVVLKAIWNPASPGWADATTFPAYHASPNLVSAATNASGVLSPLAFRVQSSAMTEVPQVGQSIGFLDVPNLTFRRKKILTVTAVAGSGGTQYDLTVDTTNGISDTSYTPLSGQPCCPWSDSLQSLVTAVVSYFDVLGPGEQFASFFDPGLRQKRSPASPQFYPSIITNRLLGGTVVPQPPQGPQQNQPAVPTLYNTPTLADIELIEPVSPFPTPVGTPGVSSNLLTLGALVAFPEP